MRPYRPFLSRKPQLLCWRCESKRWVSHEKSTMTLEALTERVQSGLGDQVKLDSEKKVITTAQGSLPMSPIFDPAWIKAHQRERKTPVVKGQTLNRFRRKLVVNPYAQALATPIRECQITRTHLPKHFLQDWEVVKHPATGKMLFAPGPQAFEDVQPQIRPYQDSASHEAEGNASSGMLEGEPSPPLDPETTEPVRHETSQEPERSRRGPITGYCLSSQSLTENISKRGQSGRILGGRSGMALDSKVRGAAWRPDMANVLLNMLRREAVDGLLCRSNRKVEPVNKFIEPCQTWQDVNEVKRKMSILWIPETASTAASARRYATFDRQGASYDRKVAVHNLPWLLGQEELQRLRDSSAMFRDHEILVLRHWNSHSMRKLHQLLWRLQGYLDNDGPDKGLE